MNLLWTKQTGTDRIGGVKPVSVSVCLFKASRGGSPVSCRGTGVPCAQAYLAQLLFQQVPLLWEGFPELLLVSDQQRQFADGTIQQIFRTLLHHVAESVRLEDQHGPGLLQRTKEHRQTTVKVRNVFSSFSTHHLQSLSRNCLLYLILSSSPNSVFNINVLDLLNVLSF